MEKVTGTDLVVCFRLYCDDVHSLNHQSCLFTLYHTLEVLTKSIAPILPSLAEEVYKFHPEKSL